MRVESGFSLIELLIVILILTILVTLSVLTLSSNRRTVKTDDAAGAIYTLMRQARVQAITRRQFYAVVINVAGLDQTIPLNNSTKNLLFLANSVSLVDMGTISSVNDEEISLSKLLPIDVTINAAAGLPSKTTAFLAPENAFSVHNFSSSVPNGTFVCYFDPAGRAVTRADGTGTQEYRIFQFSANDIDLTKGPTLLRAVTLHGSTGGLKFWRFIPTLGPSGQWTTKLN
ncbi:MAG: prepilin-type N-terminal cleavage/methylation domain-containing protein [Acidobacteriota bacterium]